MRRKFILSIIVLMSIIFYFTSLIDKKNNDQEIYEYKPQEHLLYNNDPILNKVFDLTIIPTEDYKSIPCRLSKSINDVIVTICVHNLTVDSWVSESIWNKGVWEEDIVKNVLNTLAANPDCLFLDIGGQVGQYSLYAAKMGYNVLTVEPFYDNIMRIHKAAFNESFGNKITLITNAISNKKGEIKLLKKQMHNIGGQSLIENKNKVFTKDDIKPNDIDSKYFVETILFDDIVYNLPLKKDGTHHTSAVMKIDIEAYEPYAFQHAAKLFQKLNILVIFMGNLQKLI